MTATATRPGYPDAGARCALDEELLRLLYADDDVVRAQFDAIVAAEWPAGPPVRPGRPAPGRREPAAATPWRGYPAEPPRTPRGVAPHGAAWGRPRSPPG